MTTSASVPAPPAAPPTDDDRLNTLFREHPAEMWEKPEGSTQGLVPTPDLPPSQAYRLEYQQWACEPNGGFRPTCATTRTLPSQVYSVQRDDRGLFFQRMTMTTDSLIVLDDTASERVVQGIRRFWTSQDSYQRYQLVYKRGILLFGPAGAGKTASVMLLAQELIALGGMVVMVFDPHLTGVALQHLRQVEPTRPLILVLEDIDELIKQHGEHVVLALLDGEYQISNIVSLATTNYPERLGPRIINRPSRFDERIFIDTPNPLARERYLRHITSHDPSPVPPDLLARWVEDSQGFSIAHLRELVIAVRCLGHEYSEVISRLRSMHRQVRALEDYPAQRGGFSQQGEVSYGSAANGSKRNHGVWRTL